jgi:CRISPR system Cascade subunit CasE
VFDTLAEFKPLDPAKAYQSLMRERIGRGGPLLISYPVELAHKLVWDLFPERADAARNFLYRVLSEEPLRVLVRSPDRTTGSRDRWTILAEQQWDPTFPEGTRLAFNTIVAAVTSRPVPGGKRGKREDVVVAAWRRAGLLDRTGKPPKIDETTPEDEVRRDLVGVTAAKEWLARQAAMRGFALEDGVTVSDYDRWKLMRPAGGNAPVRVIVGTLTFTGVLRVADSAVFAEVLAKGLGVNRSFGFGLVRVASI